MEKRKTMGKRKRREVPLAHPGEILMEEFLKPLDMSMNQLALAIRVPNNRIGEIVEGTRAISADTALRLGRFFATGAEFWVNLQAHYDLEKARERVGEQIRRDVQPRAA